MWGDVGKGAAISGQVTGLPMRHICKSLIKISAPCRSMGIAGEKIKILKEIGEPVGDAISRRAELG